MFKGCMSDLVYWKRLKVTVNSYTKHVESDYFYNTNNTQKFLQT